jgi:prepilin-type N-terminal cleavage/methylation domain-containing protein
MAITARMTTYTTTKRRHFSGVDLLMRTRAYKTGFTLIEMIAVVAIIVVLVSMVLHITRSIDNQSKERLTRGTFTLIGNALEQFRDFGFEYKDSFYDGLVFPLDCNDFPLTSAVPYPNLQDTLHNALYAPTAPAITIGPVAQHSTEFSGSEALYFILSQVPDCRTVLNKIDKSLLTNKGINNITDIIITVPSGVNATSTVNLPFTRIVDPWGTTLRYDYYPEYRYFVEASISGTYLNYRNSSKRTFPVLTSAGPDKLFDTPDDISSMK